MASPSTDPGSPKTPPTKVQKPKRSAIQTYRLHRFLEAMFFSMAWTMHTPFHIKVVGFQEFMLVFMGTLYEIAIMTFEVPTGVVADLYSRRLSVVIGWVVMGLAFLIEGALPLVPVVIAVQLLIGIGDTFVSGAHDAWATDEVIHTDPSVNPSSVILRGQQAAFAGRLVGPWLGALAAQGSLRYALIASGIGFLIFGGTAYWRMTEVGFQKSNGERQFWSTFKQGWTLVRTTQVLALVLLVALVHGFAAEGFDRLWNKHVLDMYRLPNIGPLNSDTWWAVLRTAATLVAIVMTWFVRKKVDSGSTRSIATAMLVLTVMLIGSVFGFAFLTAFWPAMLLFVFGRAIRATIEPLTSTWVNLHATPEVRATMLSFKGQAHSIGEIAGGPIVGAIAQVRSAGLAIQIAAMMLLPSLPIIAKARKLGSQTPDPAKS